MPSDQQFIKIYDQHAEAIFRFCYWRVFERERAKELMQEAFTRTWEYIARGHELKNIRAFVYQVARNLIIDDARKRKTVSLDALAEAGYDPAFDERHRIETQIDASIVRRMLASLDEKYREAVILRYCSDLSPKEIGQILGEKENTVSVHISRGIKQLQAILRHD